jgi:uncharacterized protein (TIGR03086 family)
MTEASERYARLAGAFADKIAAVPDDKWSSPSPCDGWDARAVVDHVVSTQGMFLGFVGQELGDIPSAGDDPAGAWDAARAAVQANLDDPAKAAAEFEGFMGPTTFEKSVDTFLNTDLVVHGWDLARAAGLDDTIVDEDIERVRRYMEPLGDNLRNPQAFGPEVEPAAGASEQDKLLAFLGRRV